MIVNNDGVQLWHQRHRHSLRVRISQDQFAVSNILNRDTGLMETDRVQGSHRRFVFSTTLLLPSSHSLLYLLSSPLISLSSSWILHNNDNDDDIDDDNNIHSYFCFILLRLFFSSVIFVLFQFPSFAICFIFLFILKNRQFQPPPHAIFSSSYFL